MTTRSGKALRSTERRSTGEGIGRAPFIAHAAPYVARRQGSTQTSSTSSYSSARGSRRRAGLPGSFGWTPGSGTFGPGSGSETSLTPPRVRHSRPSTGPAPRPAPAASSSAPRSVDRLSAPRRPRLRRAPDPRGPAPTRLSELRRRAPLVQGSRLAAAPSGGSPEPRAARRRPSAPPILWADGLPVPEPAAAGPRPPAPPLAAPPRPTFHPNPRS